MTDEEFTQRIFILRKEGCTIRSITENLNISTGKLYRLLEKSGHKTQPVNKICPLCNGSGHIEYKSVLRKEPKYKRVVGKREYF